MAIPGISGTQSTLAPTPLNNEQSSVRFEPSAESTPLVDVAAKTLPVKQPPPVPLSQSDIKTALDAINKYLAPNSSDIQFVEDKDSGLTLVKIVDTATGKVIRQIPTEQIVEISRDLVKLQGLLVKEKA